MKIREIDKKEIYVSHLIGYSKDSGIPIYTKPIKTKAQIIINKSAKIVQDNEGVAQQYDLKLFFEYNNINKYINSLTRFWVNETPIEDNYNYLPLKVSEWENQILSVSLKKVGQNWQSIYTYSNEYGIYEIQGYFDFEKSILRLPKNSYFNMSVNKKIWTSEPIDSSQTEDLYKLVEKYEEQDFVVYKLKKVINENKK